MMKFCFLLLIFIFRISHLWAIDTKAEQVIVIDFKNNEVLFEKNADQLVPPASMTKIMSVYIGYINIIDIYLSMSQL